MRLRVLVISTNRERAPQALVPAGPHLVAAAARAAGHDAEVLDLCFVRDPARAVAQALRRDPFDVIGLSIRNLDNCDACSPHSYLPYIKRIVETCRAHCAAPIVLGGSATSQVPEAMLPYLGAEFAVVGEGECPFPALLQALETGADPALVPGVASVREGAFHIEPSTSPHSLNDLPRMEPRRITNLGSYRGSDATWPLQTKRGCGLRCSYCVYPLIEGSHWRLRDPDLVAEELVVARQSGLRMAELVDSVFGFPADHALACCEAAAAVDGPPLCAMELNPGAVTPELMEGMNAARFTAVAITAESGSDTMLAALGKNYDVSQLHRASRHLRRLQAAKMWIFMLGGPGENVTTVRETVNFIDSLPATDMVFVTHGVRILPRTALQRDLIASGELAADDSLLWPTFYQSPQITPAAAEALLGQSTFPRTNRVTISDAGHPLVPVAQRVVAACRFAPPYWRHMRRLNMLRRALHL